MFSGKPLTSAGGPPEQQSPTNLMLWGQMVDTRHFMRSQNSGNEASLVPKEWELVKRSAAGKETILASSVLAFDVSTDGRVIYTDGGRVLTTANDGTEEVLAKDAMIERVSWLAS